MSSIKRLVTKGCVAGDRSASARTCWGETDNGKIRVISSRSWKVNDNWSKEKPLSASQYILMQPLDVAAKQSMYSIVWTRDGQV